MGWNRFGEGTIIFAFAHASVGCLVAALLAQMLKRHSAATRCWVWRFGLLKGPLALLLAVPVAVLAPTIVPTTATEPDTFRTIHKLAASTPAPAPLNPWPVVYCGGLVTVLVVRVVRSNGFDRRMPRVEGVLRPRVFIPSELDADHAAMALAHESAHIRRRDPQWSLAADLICTLLWFALPAWLCARAMRADAEAACDAEALHQTGAAKRAYADLLLSFAGAAPANALSGPARRLSRRIHMLEKTPRYLPRITAGALVVTGLFVLVPWRAEAQAAYKTQPPASILSSSEKERSELQAEKLSLRKQVAAMKSQLQKLQAESRVLKAQARRDRQNEVLRHNRTPGIATAQARADASEAFAKRAAAQGLIDAQRAISKQQSQIEKAQVEILLKHVTEESVQRQKAMADMSQTLARQIQETAREEAKRARTDSTVPKRIAEAKRLLELQMGAMARSKALSREEIRAAIDAQVQVQKRLAEAQRSLAEHQAAVAKELAEKVAREKARSDANAKGSGEKP